MNKIYDMECIVFDIVLIILRGLQQFEVFGMIIINYSAAHLEIH